MPYNKPFLDWLDSNRGMSTRSLAEEVDVTAGTVRKWLYIERIPELGHAVHIEYLSRGLVVPHHFVDADRILRGLKPWFGR